MMFHVEHIQNCPVCGSQNHQHFLTCTDQSFSKKPFEIVACSDCGFKFTNPRPDENSIGQFYHFADYVSHTDSKKGLINWLYHIVKKRALKQKLKLVSSYFSQEKTLLDYGCGSGDFLGYCMANSINAFGVEQDDNTRQRAIEKYNANIISPKDFSADQKRYEVISLWHVLEHLHHLNHDIELLKNHLTQNGRLLIAVPNPTSYDAKFYSARWAAYDVPRHLYHFEKQNIIQLFAKHDLVVETIKPMVFDSFYVSLLSEKQSNGFFPRAFFIGLLSNIFGMGKTPNHSSLIYVLKKG
jgi:2-polyprenyl-3-methyl-5-hydroxy-6-metoxy-1,4-benzoquinol methylase